MGANHNLVPNSFKSHTYSPTGWMVRQTTIICLERGEESEQTEHRGITRRNQETEFQDDGPVDGRPTSRHPKKAASLRYAHEE